MASNAFGSKSPRRPHLVDGPGGLAGEIRQLRADVDAAFEVVEGSGIRVQDFGTVPIQGVDADGIVTAAATSLAPVTFTGATLDGVLAPGTGNAVINTPKLVTITAAGATPAHFTGGDLVVTGTDVDGAAQTETITCAAGAGTTTGTKYFATVSSVAVPAQGGVGATIEVGVAADTACIANGTSTAAAQVIDVNSEFNRARVGNRAMPCARSLRLVLSNHADWDATNAVVTGLDINDEVLTETLAIPNGGNTTVAGTKFFAQVTRIDIPAQSGTGGTWSLGIEDTTVGFDKEILGGAIAAVVIRELTRDNTADTTWAIPAAGAVTAPASALPNGSYTPVTAPDGARQYMAIYVPA